MRVQLWSCGGGRQSAGIAALIVQGRLPHPDHVVMVALEWEIRSVWPYVNAYIRPALRKLGIPFPLYNTRFKNMVEDYYAPTNITINQLGLYNADMENNIKETIDWLKITGVNYFPYWNKKYQK